VESVSCLGATHIADRWDESGRKYKATADDAAYASFRLAGGAVAHFNSSWCVRVRRDDLATFQVDGTKGSAVAGLTRCFSQSLAETPRPVWNPDVRQSHDFLADWREVADETVCDNAFKAEWELFIRHVCEGSPFKWNLLEGAKGLQLVDCALKSWRTRRWIDIPRLKA
jgi:predicted dehydrogenase